jgi:cellulose synthase operon protein C
MTRLRFKVGNWRVAVMGAMLIFAVSIPALIFLRGAPKAQANAAFNLAQSYRAKHDLIAARKQLQIAVKVNPKWVAANMELANVALELLDGEGALAAIDGARAAGVNPSELQHLRGHALWLQGDFDSAEAALSGNNIPDSNQIYAKTILARIYTDRGNFSAASSTLEDALSASPDDTKLWTEIARMRLADGNQKGAIDAADKALALDSANVRALEIRGRLARTQTGFRSALQFFEQALKANPSDVPVLAEYAATLGDTGRATDMLKPIRKLVSIDRHFGNAYYMQAVIAARAGEFALAKRILDRAGDATNALPAARLLFGVCEYQLGNYNSAANTFQKLVDLQPLNLQARRLLARAMFRSGNSFGTLDLLRPTAERADADSYSLHLVARALEATGQPTKVAPLLARAQIPAIRDTLVLPEPLSFLTTQDEAKRAPNDARRVIPYIRNLVKSGDLGSAQSLANQLQIRNPNVADAHILAGDVAMLRGQRGAALAAFAKARAISFSEPLLLKIVDANRRNGNETAARAVIAAFFAENPNSVSALRLSAYVDLDMGKWKSAVPKLEQLLARMGYGDVVLDANLARAYSAIGSNEKAINLADIGYRIDPSNPMVTYTYGGVLFKAGKRPKAALALLKKAALLSPGNQEVQKTFATAKANLQPKPKPKPRPKPIAKKPAIKT